MKTFEVTTAQGSTIEIEAERAEIDGTLTFLAFYDDAEQPVAAFRSFSSFRPMSSDLEPEEA